MSYILDKRNGRLHFFDVNEFYKELELYIKAHPSPIKSFGKSKLSKQQPIKTRLYID